MSPSTCPPGPVWRISGHTKLATPLRLPCRPSVEYTRTGSSPLAWGRRWVGGGVRPGAAARGYEALRRREGFPRPGRVLGRAPPSTRVRRVPRLRRGLAEQPGQVLAVAALAQRLGQSQE